MVTDRHVVSDLPAELHGCLEAFRRCVAVVERIDSATDVDSEAVYARVGPHLRHCLDHFTCLLRAIDRGAVIDYDARERDPVLEADPKAFVAALAGVRSRLCRIAPRDLARRVRVRQSAAPDGKAATSESNLGRELVFLSGHTVHHLEIVRLLCETVGVGVPDGWTTAYSTEAYRARLEPGAK
jgi:hypothetical protein